MKKLIFLLISIAFVLQVTVHAQTVTKSDAKETRPSQLKEKTTKGPVKPVKKVTGNKLKTTHVKPVEKKNAIPVSKTPEKK